MMRILFLYCIATSLVFCSCCTYRYYNVNDSLFKRCHVGRSHKPTHDVNRSESKYYTFYLPDSICEKQDTLALVNVAARIFRHTQSQKNDWCRQNVKLIMNSDSTGYFDFHQRILHGYRKYSYFKNECIIVFSAGSSD